MAIDIYKISSLDIPNQILIGGKVLNEHVFVNLGHFCQTYKHNEIGWLQPIALDKVGKEKNELRDSNSHLNLQVFMSSWKETHVSHSHRTEITENLPLVRY